MFGRKDPGTVDRVVLLSTILIATAVGVGVVLTRMATWVVLRKGGNIAGKIGRVGHKGRHIAATTVARLRTAPRSRPGLALALVRAHVRAIVIVVCDGLWGSEKVAGEGLGLIGEVRVVRIRAGVVAIGVLVRVALHEGVPVVNEALVTRAAV